jgi:hypothetical protein
MAEYRGRSTGSLGIRTTIVRNLASLALATIVAVLLYVLFAVALAKVSESDATRSLPPVLIAGISTAAAAFVAGMFLGRTVRSHLPLRWGVALGATLVIAMALPSFLIDARNVEGARDLAPAAAMTVIAFVWLPSFLAFFGAIFGLRATARPRIGTGSTDA